MANAAPYKHGEFCWFEVNTPDAEAAKKFYGALFGWKTQQMDMGGFPYHTLHVGDKSVGGIMPMTGPEWQGVPPHWMLYIAVDDIDAAARKVVELDVRVCVPPTTIPVGRFAVVNDPQGATFSLFQAK